MNAYRRRHAVLRFCAVSVALIALATPTLADETGFAAVQTDVRRFNDALATPATGLADAVAAIIDHRLDLASFTREVFQDYCREALDNYDSFMSRTELAELVALHEIRLQTVFRDHLISTVTESLRRGQFSALRITRVDSSYLGTSIEVDLDGPEGDGSAVLTLQMDGASWQITDIECDGDMGSELMRREFGDIIDREYSLSVLVADILRRPFVLLEDFSTTVPGRLPEGWGWRKRDRDKLKPYRVAVDGSDHYLAAQDTGSSVILLKYAHWNPREFPILTWCWRARALPPGADERYGPTNDSAAGLYVIFSQNWFGLPKQIKYVWSSTLPVGTVDRRKRIARPWFFVVESGAENVDRWVFEQVDLVRDYGRVYRGKPKTRTLGLGILTDANSTHSYAEADYADFRVWTRQALLSGAVSDHCSCAQRAAELESEHGAAGMPGRRSGGRPN